MSQAAAHLVDHVIPHVPVLQWVQSLSIPLRVLLAAQPELVAPALEVQQRVVTRHLLDGAGLKADKGQGGAVKLFQRFGSAANLNIHLHCLVLNGAHRRRVDGSPAFNSTGQVELKLKTPWRGGTTHLVVSPLEFMQRIAALASWSRRQMTYWPHSGRSPATASVRQCE